MKFVLKNDHWMSSRMTIYHTWVEALCEGVSENSGAWYMVTLISFHGMTCRIPYIDPSTLALFLTLFFNFRIYLKKKIRYNNVYL